MSNVPAGRRGVSTAQLVVFILLILASGVAAYVFHTEADRLENKLKTERETLRRAQVGLANALKTRDDLYQALGYSSLDQIKRAFEASQIKVQPRILEKLTEEKFKKRTDQIKQIGMDPKDVDEAGKSLFLEQIITRARRSAVVPDNLKDARVGDLISQLIRRDKAVGARKDVVDQGEVAVTAVDRKITDKKAETKRKFTEMDDKAVQAWKEREVERDKLRFEPIKWAAEEKVLVSKLTLEQRINRKLKRRQKVQRDMATPVDGKIVSYNWQTRRGIINLGARDNVKAGYRFYIYSTRPGPDRADKRLYSGIIELLNAYAETSLFTVIPSEWDVKERPVMSGNLVCSQVYDETRPKTFVLKGWFPKGGDHSKAGIAGMIDRDGGVVKDELTLDTDYVIVGIIDEKDMTNPSEEAKKAIAEGAEAYKNARHWYVTVLTTEKFFKYMDRVGMIAAP